MAQPSPPKDWNKSLRCLVDRSVGKMRVLQRGRWIIVAKEPAYGEDRLAMGQCHRGKSVSQIVATDIDHARFGAYIAPEKIKRFLRQVAFST